MDLAAGVVKLDEGVTAALKAFKLEEPSPRIEPGPGSSEEAHQSAEGTKDSSLFTVVPKVGVEPTLYC